MKILLNILGILIFFLNRFAGRKDKTAPITANVWISGDPSDNNWSDMTAGKWTVYITYVNYTNF